MKVPQTYRIRFNYQSSWGEVIKSGIYPAYTLLALSSERKKELEDKGVLVVESYIEVPNTPPEEISSEEELESTPKPRRPKKIIEGQ